MKNIQDKINKIDKLLKDEELFEKYINDLEVSDVNVKSNLSKDILNKINNESKKKKINLINVLKIAACTLFAIGIWQSGIFDNTLEMNHQASMERENTFYTNFEEKLANINNIMLSPIRIERGD